MSAVPLAGAGLCLLVGLLASFELRRRLELVANAEHELRGPASGLSLACETLRRDPATRRHAVVLEAQLDRLRAGLADLEAARSGRRAECGRTPVEIAAAAQAAVRPWRDWLGSAGFEWEGGPAPTVLDRRRLAQALGNLMANAAEHGAGQVQVRGRTTARGVRIEVRNRLSADGGRRASRDRGRGIAIATRAARDLGGRLLVSFDGERAVAVLELPLTALEPSDGPSGAEAA
ncbi:MAG TPA: ATP-binding protein [Thermoleophilaceae bacterium]|nr:ATP-binding protein [Thermoleophilaceae bacterium]